MSQKDKKPKTPPKPREPKIINGGRKPSKPPKEK